MSAIQFVNLKRQYESIKPEIQKAIEEVLESTNFILGANVDSFEREFAFFCGASYCVGVGNGTDALTLALKALGLRQGEIVVTVPHTFIATSEAISYAGGVPCFVDIDPGTYLLDPLKLEATLTELRNQGQSVRAVIAVHLYGQPCDMDAINKIAHTFEIAVIEDAAQAHGAEYKGRRVGILSDIACFSFYPGKNLGAYGDAGAVVTNNPDLAHQIRLLRNHGRTKKYEHIVEGFNFRIDALQAAILRVKLKHLARWNSKRQENARRYTDNLSSCPGVVCPVVSPEVKHVFHLYVVQVPEREKIVLQLKNSGIETGIHYPLPLHLQPAYSYLNYQRGDFPVTESISERILSLPLDAEITSDEIDIVCQKIKEICG